LVFLMELSEACIKYAIEHRTHKLKMGININLTVIRKRNYKSMLDTIYMTILGIQLVDHCFIITVNPSKIPTRHSLI